MRDLQLATIDARSKRIDLHIERLARIEWKLDTIGDLLKWAACLGVGMGLGYQVEHYGTGWGWPAAAVGGIAGGVFMMLFHSTFYKHARQQEWAEKRAEIRAREQARNG